MKPAHKQVCYQVWGQVNDEVWYQLQEKQVWDQVNNQLWFPTCRQVRTQVMNKIQ